MTATDTFEGKNALRRLSRGPAGSSQRRRYNQARSLRQQLLTNGVFGRLDGDMYDTYAVGTSAEKPS